MYCRRTEVLCKELERKSGLNNIAENTFIQDARLRSLPSRQLPYVWQNSLSQGETASGVIAAGIFHNEFDPKHKFYKAGKIPFST